MRYPIILNCFIYTFMIQCASHLNLGHAIQVINQGDPLPDRILPPTRPPPIMTGEATPLRVSGVATWISVLVLYLFAAANY